jgi:NAD(P)-dependent dehydrogenase (short-subunit alcohol dehydrogenase family)
MSTPLPDLAGRVTLVVAASRGIGAAAARAFAANHPDASPAIVNTGSVAGLNALPHLAPYVAGKAVIIALTKVAALDYAAHGIRVNALAPGPVATDRILALPRQAQDGVASTVPMHRLNTTTEIADAILWLCSPAASFVTGTVIPIDGGQSIAHPQRQPMTSAATSSPAATTTVPDPGQL